MQHAVPLAGVPGQSPDRTELRKGNQPPLRTKDGVGWGHTGSPSPEESREDGWDEAATVRAAQLSSAAFAPLYDRYLARVYRYVRVRVDNDDLAADLTQEIFLRTLTALPAYQPRGVPFAAWLFRIARNAVTDAHRRRRPTASLDGLPEMPYGEDGDPEQAALRDEARRRLLGLLSWLDPAKRELLALRFAAGLTAPEIAVITGKSEAAVKKQLSRTLNQLKEQYRVE